MTIEIKKTKIKSCDICGDKEVPQIPDPDAEQNEELMELVDDPNWEGVDGYVLKDEESLYWRSTRICTECVTKLLKGMNLMNANKLTKIAL